MKPILLIMIGLSAYIHAEFTTTSQPSGVVKDTSTQLVWQDDYSDNGGSIKNATWTDAIDYCDGLSLAGGGWRLPNKKELLSLVDYSKYNPSINGIFSHTTSGFYWSSTTYADNTDDAWVVNFNGGDTDDNYKPGTNGVRCVR